MQAAINPNTALSSEEKKLMLALWAGHMPHNHITTAFHFLDLHCPRPMLRPALEWLKANKLSGKRLHEFIVGNFGLNFSEFQRYLLSKIHKDKDLRLVAGKTFHV